MQAMEWRRPPYLLSTDPSLLDIEVIHPYLCNRSYWAAGRSREAVATTIRHSLNFGLYDADAQIGYARLVTDYVSFAWLADVFVLEAYRGQGLAKWLMECLLSHPDVQPINRIALGTRDAHGLYAQYGFNPLAMPERFMERRKIP